MTWTAAETIEFKPGTLWCFIILAVIAIVILARDNKKGD